MTIKQLKKLSLNDRVQFAERGGKVITGTVSEKGYAGLRVTWEDGLNSNFQFNQEPREQGVLPHLETIT